MSKQKSTELPRQLLFVFKIPEGMKIICMNKKCPANNNSKKLESSTGFL